ncbi:hypothetical protein FRB94_010443 [Tulasnella sp. JGI-2019a]|nr:hypothetical protein FRB94_010443 [Tulasnella sp. JGI-2019a]
MSLIVLKDGHPLPHYLLGSRNAPRKTQRLDSKCHKSPVTGAPDGDAGDNGNGNNEDEDEVGSIEKKKAIVRPWPLTPFSLMRSMFARSLWGLSQCTVPMPLK